MPEASIVVTATDKYSDAIKKMSNVTKSFNKDQDAMEAKLKRLRENQHAIQDELKESADKLKTLQKQYEATGDAAIKSARDSEQANYDAIKRNLDLVTKGAREAEKQMQKTGKSFTSTSGQAKHGMSDIVKAFSASGLSQMAGRLIDQGIGAWAGSKLGTDGGTMISSALGSMATGAAIGSVLIPIPGVGAAVGAGVGALAGVASGALQNWEKKDDYFKSYYNGIIDEQAQRREAGIQSGSAIAASREQKQMAFATLLGSDEAAADYMADVKAMAAMTNYTYDDITGYAKSLIKPFGADKSLDILTKLSDASAALSLSGSDTEVLIQGLSRMKMTGKTTQEYLNYFSERGIDVYGALSEWGDAATVTEKVRRGEIKGGDAAEAILAYIGKEFGGLSEEFANTFAGISDNLEDAKANVEEGYGIGYNETRKTGLEAEKDAYNGALGDALKELNGISGTTAAFRENLQEQYMREALEAALTGGGTTLYNEEETRQLEALNRQFEYLSAEYARTGDPELGLKLQNVKDQAETIAKAAFDSSEWAKAELSAQEENTRAIRDLAVSFDGIWAQYDAAMEKTLGRAAATTFRVTLGGNGNEPGSTYLTGGTSMTGGSSYAAGSQVNGSHASGLKRVPYDNYVALLHEGERVLTASEARQEDAGGGIVVNVSGNQFTVRSEADIDAIAWAIAEKISLARQSGVL